MDKYILKEGFAEIISRTSDGTEILITPLTFNDYFGDMMMQNNQGHLLIINPRWTEENSTEKKTFVQITEDVISLTSPYEMIEEKKQLPIVSEQESKPKRGRQPKQKE